MRNDPLAAPKTVRFTMPLVIAITAAATFLAAGSVAITRSGTSSGSGPTSRTPLATAEPIAIEERIPRNVAAFARVTVNPVGADREAIERLLRNVPAADRASALDLLDREMAKALPISIDVGAMRAALGEQMAIAWVVINGKPEIVAILEVKDAAKARREVTKTLGRGEIVVADGTVLYSGSPRAISGLRASAKRASMATHATYLKELGALGGSGLAVGWFDGTRLANVRDADLPPYLRVQAGIGGAAPDLRKSTATGAAFIDGSLLVFEMRERGGLTGALSRSSGPLPLFRSLPAATTFGFGISDPATVLRATLETVMGQGTEGLPKGMDLDQLLFSWLGDEIAISMLDATKGGVLAIAVKDDAAFERAFTTLSALAQAAGGGRGDSRAYSLSFGGNAIELRRVPGKLAVAMASDQASAVALAEGVVNGTGAPLSKGGDYGRLFGAGPASMRFFVRTENVGEMFMGPELSFLRHIRAIGYEMRVEGLQSFSRVAVSFA